MNNEQNNEQQKDPKDQARNLFFLSGLSQAQIAELVGVSQKTISIWMNEGKWRHLKRIAMRAPSILVEEMTEELLEIHKNIASRAPGSRYATIGEAEIRRKTLASIKYVQERQTKGAYAEVLTNFMHFLKDRNLAVAQSVIPFADEFMKGTVQLGSDPFEPYLLPGETNVDDSDDTPTETSNIPKPPSSPAGNGNADSLNKAA